MKAKAGECIAAVSFLFSLAIFLFTTPASAQLDKTFQRMFDKFLREDLVSVSALPFNVAYDAAAIAANQELVPALNSTITSNVAAFPLPSTNTGVSFTLSPSFEPVMLRSSKGPIFSETAETLGRGKFSFGVSVASYNLTRFRGTPLENMQFSFFPDDLTGDGQLGGAGFGNAETDVITIQPRLNIDARTAVFYAAFGLADALDAGIAVPYHFLSLHGNAQARIDSKTFFYYGLALAIFNNDERNPQLEESFRYDESVHGPGDISLRMKYSPIRTDDEKERLLDFATLVDLRLPTGREKDFLGTGKTNVSLAAIVSKKIDEFSAHLNMAYDYHGARFESNELDLALGLSQNIGTSLTIILDLLASYDLSADKITLFPGTQRVTFDQIFNEQQISFVRDIQRSNIPAYSRDHFVHASIGMKYSPTPKTLLLANFLVPLQDGGFDASGNMVFYAIGEFRGTITLDANTSFTSQGNLDFFVAKYDETGALHWVRRFFGAGDITGKSVAWSRSSNAVYVYGQFAGSATFGDGTIRKRVLTSNSIDVFIAKFDDRGNFQWVQQAGGPGVDRATRIETTGSSLWVAGYFPDQITFGSQTFEPDGTNPFAAEFWNLRRGLHICRWYTRSELSNQRDVFRQFPRRRQQQFPSQRSRGAINIRRSGGIDSRVSKHCGQRQFGHSFLRSLSAIRTGGCARGGFCHQRCRRQS